MSCLIPNQTPFYLAPHYSSHVAQELSSNTLRPVVYNKNSETVAWRVVKLVLSILIFPIFLYQLFHRLVGRSLVALDLETKEQRSLWRQALPAHFPNLRFKRITLEADDLKIDAMIIANPRAFNDGKWLAIAPPMGTCYEYLLNYSANDGRRASDILEEFRCNMILFNYPGIGESQGPTTREALERAYRLVLSFLEDNGARQIIGHGHSLGGAIQCEALLEHRFKPHLRYLFLHDRTFSTFSKACLGVTSFAPMMRSIISIGNRISGWNIDAGSALGKIEARQIILQSSCERRIYHQIEDPISLRETDGIISKESSLAYHFLTDRRAREGVNCIGVNVDHWQPLPFGLQALIAEELS